MGGEDEDEIGHTRSVRLLKPTPRPAAPVTQPVTPAPMPAPDHAALLRAERKAALDAAGESFGPYVLLGAIGRGGMGEVRLAAELGANGSVRLCVIKRARGGPDRASLEQLLLDEGRLLARIRHPNVVRLYEVGKVAGQVFLAFELIDGVSLRQLLQLLPPADLSLGTGLSIGLGAAAGLAHVHQARDTDGSLLGVVHRDLTPHNILVDRAGLVKLVDFGIARFADRAPRTRHGHVKGKLGYLAPEQLQSNLGPVGPLADVFCLGLVLTELLSGQRVLPPKLLLVLDTAPLVRERCAEASQPLPHELVELLVRMCAMEAERRPSAAEVERSLARLVAAHPIEPPLSEVLAARVFAKLLPLDLSTLLELPTRRATRRASAAEEEALGDPAGEDEESYSRTVRNLAAARRR